jgi:hypothetical protein
MKTGSLFIALKRLIPLNIKKILRHIFTYHKTAHPYKTVGPKMFPGINFSDAFLFRNEAFTTRFMAENSLALLAAEKVDCCHIFVFFSVSGKIIGEFHINDDDFHYQLDISSQFVGAEKMGSFIHQTKYSDHLLIEYSKVLGKHIFQHRGYTGYRPEKKTAKSLFSYLHGNFGALYLDQKNDIKSLARKERGYFYTPQIQIAPDKNYDLFFLNPTHKKVSVSVGLVNNEGLMPNPIPQTIEPFGIYQYSLSNHDKDITNIRWESNMALCRAIVFENKGPIYDVYHS